MEALEGVPVHVSLVNTEGIAMECEEVMSLLCTSQRAAEEPGVPKEAQPPGTLCDESAAPLAAGGAAAGGGLASNEPVLLGRPSEAPAPAPAPAPAAPISVKCSGCQKVFGSPQGGVTVECPFCRAHVVVPKEAEQAAPGGASRGAWDVAVDIRADPWALVPPPDEVPTKPAPMVSQIRGLVLKSAVLQQRQQKANCCRACVTVCAVFFTVILGLLVGGISSFFSDATCPAGYRIESERFHRFQRNEGDWGRQCAEGKWLDYLTGSAICDPKAIV